MAATKAAVLPSGSEEYVSRAPRIHHRPHVHKGWHVPYWWSTCSCGHIEFFTSWRFAYVDALIHSERLN
jgi:hypothetical protein